MYQINDFTLNQKKFNLTLELASAVSVIDKELIVKGTKGKFNEFLNQTCRLIYSKSNLKENGLAVDDLEDLPFITLQALSAAIMGSQEVEQLTVTIKKNGFQETFDLSFDLIGGKTINITDATKLSARKYKLYSDKLSAIGSAGKLTEQKAKDYYFALSSILKNETNLVNDPSVTTLEIYDGTPILVLDKVCANFIMQEDLNIEKKTE